MSLDMQHNMQDATRPLNVTDALGYLDSVKNQFQEKPDVYNQFLDIMKDFKSQVIDTPGVIQRVSKLFHGNPELIQGFNTFLPAGYRIDISADPHDHTIIVTTPTGTTTQTTGTNVILSRTTREPPQSLAGPGLVNPAMYPNGAPPPTTILSGPGAGPISRAMTPHGYGGIVGPGLHPHALQVDPATFSPGFQQQTTAASFLGNLNGKNLMSNGGPAVPGSAGDGQPAIEFNNAIQYLNKIKARYADEQNTYKHFLDILQTYQREGKNSGDNQVYLQVQMLFKDAPDLIVEFKNFLPEAVPPGAGEAFMMSQQAGGGGGGHGGPMGSWPHQQQDLRHPPSPPPAKKVAPAKRKKRTIEKEPTPVPPPPAKAVSSRAKKVKHHHIPDTDSPAFSPHVAARSPPPPPHMYPVAQHGSHGSLTSQPPPNGVQLGGAHTNGVPAPPDKLMFFDRAKKTLESKEVYDEFLKLLNLFSRDIIDLKTLVDRAKVFLGEEGLMAEFKDLVGWDEKMENPIEHGPPGSIRTQAPDAVAPQPVDDGEGPSYRRLPESEIRLACSGRDELCRSVLNDEWVSHPTWASEEAGFVAHKKNSFEEALHKSEEERHEYHVHLEALGRTISLLDPLNARIEEMAPEERAAFRLKSDFGGPSKSLYHRTIKRIYRQDNAAEIILAMQEAPSVAVPVVLARLKQKDEDWRRSLREWSRTWREVDSKNFYKSLDHQGISFKQNDKKNITARHFVADIEAIKAQQVKEWEQQEQEAGTVRKPFGKGVAGHQLEYEFSDTAVLQDSLKLVYSFLERSQVQYSPQERRTVEKFLRSFVPKICNASESEFNAACGHLEGGGAGSAGTAVPNGVTEDEGSGHEDGPRSGRRSNGSTYSNGQSSGVPANDLRKKLLKTAQEKASRKDGGAGPSVAATTGGSNTRASNSGIGSRAGTPSPAESSSRFAPVDEEGKVVVDVWIKEAPVASGSENGADVDLVRPFFANTTFYTLLRLLQLLYSRLLMCKEIGAELAEKKHAPLLANQVAADLGLVDPSGPSVVLSQSIESLGQRPPNEATPPNVVYMYLLNACEKLFDNEMDQATFEEHMRWFFGTKAYHLFTLDKLITALIKQVQTALSDHKCQELWTLLQRVQGPEHMTKQDVVRYRRSAEKHVGQDEHLYRLQWDREKKCIRVSLTNYDDPTIEADGRPPSRWREYVNTYVMTYPTEWVPPAKGRVSPTFLRRCMQGNEEGSTASKILREDHTRVRISLPTYKLVYENGCEDMLVRRWSGEEGEMLRERARARSEDRRRSRWLSV
ncbi:transcription regulatory protein [Ephemerocybe angulata]|uniref:Transcription regulatory protein n=1 Tax=Ephemerocybe angulata TaxID=980116 RepID=A0A8H6HWN1_9AGAR|nr:transcription regulatory protein [Tulosesus angulatus]